MLEAADRGDRAPASTSTRPGRGIAAAAAGGRRPPAAALRADLRPRHRGAGHHRRDRGAGRRHPGLRRPGRRGDRARAVLRLLRRLDRPGRRRRRRRSALFGPPTSRSTSTSSRPPSPRAPRLILLNSPHNPTGTVLDRERAGRDRRARRRATTCWWSATRSTSTWSSTTPSTSPLATLPGMRERTIRISSAGKTFSATGWKIGWALGPAQLIAELHRGQAVPDLRLGRAVPAGDRPGAGRRRRLGVSGPGRAAGQARPAGRRAADGRSGAGDPPRGTYFVTTDVRPLGYDDGVAFCRDLPHRCGVVAIPHSGLLRPTTRPAARSALGVLQARRRARRGRSTAR